MQLLMVAVVTAMLVTSAALATEGVYATKYKEKNQAVSQVNECGNGELAMNVLCNDVASTVQGKRNVVSLTGAQEGGDFDGKKDKDWDKDPKGGYGDGKGDGKGGSGKGGGR